MDTYRHLGYHQSVYSAPHVKLALEHGIDIVPFSRPQDLQYYLCDTIPIQQTALFRILAQGKPVIIDSAWEPMPLGVFTDLNRDVNSAVEQCIAITGNSQAVRVVNEFSQQNLTANCVSSIFPALDNLLEHQPYLAQRNHRFICLNANPRPHRKTVVEHIQQNKMGGLVSYNLGHAVEYDISIQIDTASAPNQYRGWKPHSDLLRDAELHVVTETVFEHNCTFLTEKSFKPFSFHQLPLWVSVPGTVEYFRNAGFDVFDDIIDHSYDCVTDHSTRLYTVLAEFDRLYEEQFDFSVLEPRLVSNFSQLNNYINYRQNQTCNYILEKMNLSS